MNIISVITLIGGLAFFLYGMNAMSTGLERMAGGSLERTLKKFTSNPFKSLLLGAGITIAIQSSSAMTVMLVGLVNSGIMEIGQTVGVIMGSNIGTTLTAWILSLVGIDSENIFMLLLKPENFSLLFAFVGAVLIMMSKKEKHHYIGSILVGFAVLMFGMKLMSDAVKPLRDMPEFTNILTAFTNPILGVAVGAIFTGVIQSSAASVGILQALALTGSVTYEMAIPIIMGQNIGTCVTALISSIGVNRNAKKVAVIHISFNMIGTIVLLIVYYVLDAFINFAFSTLPIDALGIAFVHSVFNVTTTLLLLPFSKMLVKIANTVLREKEEVPHKAAFLDERLLATPSVAISECYNLTCNMADIVNETVTLAIDNMNSFSKEVKEKILENEGILDRYEDKLGTYLVKLSAKNLSENDSRKVAKMLHAIGDFERLGDHAVNILKVSEELYDKKIAFSDNAIKELNVVAVALKEILGVTTSSYKTNDLELAKNVEPLEQVIDDLVATIKDQHINRLQSGDCTIEMGFVLSDLLTNYERVSDHCSNIAASAIEIAHSAFQTHKYLNNLKFTSEEFAKLYEQYSLKYNINTEN